MQDWEAIASDQAMTIAMMLSEQEPVARLFIKDGYISVAAKIQKDGEYQLYAAPPKRQPMKRAPIEDARDYLNTNDKAMWVIGWNECVEAHEIGEKT
jgi:hypothetical protein